MFKRHCQVESKGHFDATFRVFHLLCELNNNQNNNSLSVIFPLVKMYLFSCHGLFERLLWRGTWWSSEGKTTLIIILISLLHRQKCAAAQRRECSGALQMPQHGPCCFHKALAWHKLAWNMCALRGGCASAIVLGCLQLQMWWLSLSVCTSSSKKLLSVYCTSCNTEFN